MIGEREREMEMREKMGPDSRCRAYIICMKPRRWAVMSVQYRRAGDSGRTWFDRGGGSVRGHIG